MTAGSQGHVGSQGHDADTQRHGASQGHGAGLRIGVVLEAFLDWPLERGAGLAAGGRPRRHPP